MKHSDLKVGMKVKRVHTFHSGYYASTKGNISTVKSIEDTSFTVVEGMTVQNGWAAYYFEPVEETGEETKTNKITLDKKYRTRCGYPVRILCVDRDDKNFPVVALFGEGGYGAFLFH